MTGLLRMRKAASALLLVGVLVMLTAVSVTAAKNNPRTPFDATGYVTALSDGDVHEAGNSGRFVVKDRTASGFVPPGSDLAGEFSFTFGTNVPVLTQSGQIHGKVSLADGAFEANVVAQSSLAAGPGVAIILGDEGVPILVGVISVAVDGKLTFTSGTQGRGTITSTLWALVDADGHILSVAPPGLPFVDLTTGLPGTTGSSTVEIAGEWHE